MTTLLYIVCILISLTIFGCAISVLLIPPSPEERRSMGIRLPEDNQ